MIKIKFKDIRVTKCIFSLENKMVTWCLHHIVDQIEIAIFFRIICSGRRRHEVSTGDFEFRAWPRHLKELPTKAARSLLPVPCASQESLTGTSTLKIPHMLRTATNAISPQRPQVINSEQTRHKWTPGVSSPDWCVYPLKYDFSYWPLDLLGFALLMVSDGMLPADGYRLFWLSERQITNHLLGYFVKLTAWNGILVSYLS